MQLAFTLTLTFRVQSKVCSDCNDMHGRLLTTIALVHVAQPVNLSVSPGFHELNEPYHLFMSSVNETTSVALRSYTSFLIGNITARNGAGSLGF